MGRISENNTSQGHGVELENMIKISRMFSGAANIARTGAETFDIEAKCDRVFGLPTQIKTAAGDWIGLADAENFTRIELPWRLIYSQWKQVNDRLKIYEKIHELIIPLGVMRRILGDMTPEIALEWHNDVASFAAGPEGAAAARKRAAEIKRDNKGRHGLLRLDFKIDDRDQRRLQFSIRFSVLAGLVAGLEDYRSSNGHTQPHHVVHTEEFHQHPLPIRLLSPRRHIERNAEEKSEAILFDDAPRIDLSVQRGLIETATQGASLRRPIPVRRDERDRKRRAAIDTRQTALFG